MALENNAICAICGKPYRVCHTCQNIKSFIPWRTVTDTLPHYMIYLALVEYTNNGNKDKAKEELSKCDLSGLNDFDNDIKNVINEIMIDDKKETVKITNKSVSKVKKNENNIE